MNRDQLATALNSFLEDDVLQVAALSGEWGVGKTYFWRDYATSIDVSDEFNGISYASVFGADSIEEIRTRIAAGMVLSQDRDSIMQRYREQAEKLLMPRELPSKARGVLELIDRFRRGELTSLASQAAYWFVRDCVVCLDDIERLGKHVDSRALMGIIDELRERDCKVVLLLNRDQLPRHDDDFQRYWEKIVDVDLILAPNVDTNVSVVFGDLEMIDEHRAAIITIFKRVDCRNIRIHRRALGLIESVLSNTADASDTLRTALIEHSALLSWALLDPSQDLSDQVVSSDQYNSLWVAVLSHGGARDRLSPEEEKWAKIIEKTDFQPLQFDQYLVGYIRTGWLDLEGLKSAIQEVEANVGAAECQDRLRTVLRAYGGDFSLDQDQYTARLVEVLAQGVEHLSAFDYDNGLETLSMLDQDSDELAQAYIQVRGDHLQMVAEAHGRNRNFSNAILSDEVSRRETEFQTARFTIDQVANDLTGRDGWNHSQIEYLAAQSVESYVDWMLDTPTSLIQKIRAILDFRNDQKEPYPQMVQKLEDALRVLAQQNEFNANRIQSAYGVSLPGDDIAPENAEN